MTSATVEHRRLKYAATINDEALTEDTSPDYELQYVDIGNVESSGNINEIATYRFEDAPSRARRIVRDGDVIISTVRTYLQAIASIQKPSENLIVSTGFAVIRPRLSELSPSYCKYAVREAAFLAEVEMRSVGVSYPAINACDLGDIRIHLPSPQQQYTIADYLDRETARLDALIREKELLLERLAEKRRAIITRAVTRGLDSGAPLDDSNIHWFGNIPAHWRIWKVGHFATVGNGSTPNRDNAEYWTDGGIPWLNSSVVNQDEVTRADQFVTEIAFRECHLPLVKRGSILVGITGQGKTRGQAAVLSIDATINQHLAFIAPENGRVDSWYLRWVLFAAYQFLRSISDDAGGTKGALTCEEVAALRVPLPPVDEQRAIVAHIATETVKLEALRSATERTIGLLRERRAALIASAVTGRLLID